MKSKLTAISILTILVTFSGYSSAFSLSLSDIKDTYTSVKNKVAVRKNINKDWKADELLEKAKEKLEKANVKL